MLSERLQEMSVLYVSCACCSSGYSRPKERTADESVSSGHSDYRVRHASLT